MAVLDLGQAEVDIDQLSQERKDHPIGLDNVIAGVSGRTALQTDVSLRQLKSLSPYVVHSMSVLTSRLLLLAAGRDENPMGAGVQRAIA